MAAVLRGVGGLSFTALRLTVRLLRRLQRGSAPQHLLPVAGLDQEKAHPLLIAIREAAREVEVIPAFDLRHQSYIDVLFVKCAALWQSTAGSTPRQWCRLAGGRQPMQLSCFAVHLMQILL